MDLTAQEKNILLQIIGQSRFTPDEWEVSVKPIVMKLNEKEETSTKAKPRN